jgi:SnoaL-like domain
MRGDAIVPIEDWRALTDLVHEFAYRVDFGPAETIADLFIEDGWYGWGEKRSVGRDAIRDTYRQRAARGLRTARHLCTNLRFSMLSDDKAQGQSIWLLFAEDGPPPHAAVPLLVADVNDVFVRQNMRWLFESRQLTDVFVAPERKPVLPLTSGA